MVEVACVVNVGGHIDNSGGGMNHPCGWWWQLRHRRLGGGHIINAGMEVAHIDDVGGGCVLQMVVACVVNIGGSHV